MKRFPWLANVASDSSIGYSLLRIYLGVGLIVRGALFISEPEVLLSFLRESSSKQWFIPLAISHYVAAAHICGGILLALGLGTRVAAALQVPALIGAVFIVHFGEGLMRAGQSLEFSALVLCMLFVYSVFGGGKVSVDSLLEQRLSAHTEAELESLRPPPGASRIYWS